MRNRYAARAAGPMAALPSRRSPATEAALAAEAATRREMEDAAAAARAADKKWCFDHAPELGAIFRGMSERSQEIISWRDRRGFWERALHRLGHFPPTPAEAEAAALDLGAGGEPEEGDHEDRHAW